MVGVHVGVYLEDEAREGGLVGRDFTLFGSYGSWGGSDLDEAVEELLYPEVVERRTKEDGGDLPC